MASSITRRHSKGAALLELIIVAAILGVITASLLNLYRFGRDMFLESKASLVASGALDTVMTYFEDDIANWTATASFVEFASPTNLTNINNTPGGGSDLLQALNQLSNWRVLYKIDQHNSGRYADRMVTLRITWDGIRRDAAGNPVQRREEIFSVFTGSSW